MPSSRRIYSNALLPRQGCRDIQKVVSMVGELADQLRQKREEKGLSLKDVQSQTRIPELYLHILEGRGNPRLLADTLYLIPFLRTYSSFLELDPGVTVAQFLADLPKYQDAVGETPDTVRSSLQWGFIGALILVGLALGMYWWQGSQP